MTSFVAFAECGEFSYGDRGGDNLNYFIEGVQGAGKSTLVSMLAKELPTYQVFREGDYNPVELAWLVHLSVCNRRFAQHDIAVVSLHRYR